MNHFFWLFRRFFSLCYIALLDPLDWKLHEIASQKKTKHSIANYVIYLYVLLCEKYVFNIFCRNIQTKIFLGVKKTSGTETKQFTTNQRGLKCQTLRQSRINYGRYGHVEKILDEDPTASRLWTIRTVLDEDYIIILLQRKNIEAEEYSFRLAVSKKNGCGLVYINFIRGPTTSKFRNASTNQWIFLVPVKGGRDYITTQKARTISGI